LDVDFLEPKTIERDDAVDSAITGAADALEI
jgi:hypothetical protein